MIKIQDLAHLQAARKRAGLQLYPHSRMEILAIGVRVQAHHPDGARVGIPQPDHALDRGGLPRPVRAQDAEDLPFPDRERDIIDRNRGPVGLAEMRDLDSNPAIETWGESGYPASCRNGPTAMLFTVAGST